MAVTVPTTPPRVPIGSMDVGEEINADAEWLAVAEALNHYAAASIEHLLAVDLNGYATEGLPGGFNDFLDVPVHNPELLTSYRFITIAERGDYRANAAVAPDNTHAAGSITEGENTYTPVPTGTATLIVQIDPDGGAATSGTTHAVIFAASVIAAGSLP